jgi:pyridoxal phosphate enzyme (YggS family)
VSAPDDIGSRTEEIRSRLGDIRRRVEHAAKAAGRSGTPPRVVAVTKRLGADDVLAAYAAGHRDFGENYVQEAATKIAGTRAAMPDARWHFIGRLQSNKAGVAIRNFSLLHGIDSLTTVAALSRAAFRENCRIDLLLQIRLGHRGGQDGTAQAEGPARGGVEAGEAREFLLQASFHEGIRFVGLMGVADPDLPARTQFAGLRELSAALAAEHIERAPLGELSMGMTGDFEDAVAEGATIVRIGTAIFGERRED